VTRGDGRRPDHLRPTSFDVDFVENPAGHALIRAGRTMVLCTASVQESVPRWMYGKGRGWLTAEYSMLPASTGDRTDREASRGKQGGRTVEIQRLIGRALRAVVDYEALGERTVWVDCDVLQADGGTRCASITGAYVAVHRALDRVGLSRALAGSIAAVSVGIVGGMPVLDLDYAEDSQADTDANFVMTGAGRIVEVQGTAEKVPFTEEQFLALLALAKKGVMKLVDLQKMAVM
jgi:ribonuclease PH